MSDSLWNLNLYRWLIGWFAVLTLLLSAVGLYGVVSYSVTSRRREWAVRLALGSSPANVARIVLRRGFALTAIGVSFGVVLVTWAIRSAAGDFPFIAEAAGGTTVTAIGLVMFAVALAASWLPAQRVARTAPASALRAD